MNRGVFRAGGIPLNTILFALRILTLTVVGVLLLPLLIHSIGKDSTGLFTYATTLTGYFTAVELGLATSVTKYTAQLRAADDNERLNSVLRGSLLLMIGIGAAIALLLAGLALFAGRSLFNEPSLRHQAIPALLVASGLSLLYWPARLGTATLEGLERYDVRSVVGIAIAVINLAGIAGITAWTHSVTVLVAWFTTLLILEGAICGVIAWPQLGVRRGIGSWRGNHLREVMGFGSALFLIGMADTIVYALDRTIVAGFVGAAGIVIYEVALRPHNGIRAISALAGSALVSTATRMVAENRPDRLRELVLFGSLAGVVITTPVVVLVMVLAKPLVVIWLGPSYARYDIYIQLFVSYWLIHANTGVLGSAVTGIGRMRTFVIMSLASSFVTLAISIPLTASVGTIGVIWGIVIPSWLGLPIWMHFALRMTGVSWGEYLRNVVLPGYGVLAAWSAPIIALRLALHPESFGEVAIFGVVAVIAYWAAVTPLVRSRWQRALAAAAAP
jgi:O-antigen/teichoic acid export membrane protein